MANPQAERRWTKGGNNTQTPRGWKEGGRNAPGEEEGSSANSR
jgi:hypothetical protein